MSEQSVVSSQARSSENLKRLCDPVKYREALGAVLTANTEARVAGIGMLYLMNDNKSFVDTPDAFALANNVTNPKYQKVASKFRYVMQKYPAMSGSQVLQNVHGVDPTIVFGKLAEEPEDVFKDRKSLDEAANRIVRELNSKPEYANFRKARKDYLSASEQVQHVGLKPETLQTLQQMSFPTAYSELKKGLLPQDVALARINIYDESRSLEPAEQLLVMQTVFNRALGKLEKDKNGNNALPPGAITRTILAKSQFSWANEFTKNFSSADIQRMSVPELQRFADHVIQNTPTTDTSSNLRAEFEFRTAIEMMDHDTDKALTADNGMTPTFGQQPPRALTRLKLPSDKDTPEERARALPANGFMKYLQGSGYTGLQTAFYHTKAIHAPSDAYRQDEATNHISASKNGHIFQEDDPKRPQYALRTLPKLGSSSRALTSTDTPAPIEGSMTETAVAAREQPKTPTFQSTPTAVKEPQPQKQL